MQGAAEHKRQVEECVAHLKQLLPFTPDLLIQLGTGLGHFGDRITSALMLPYSEIPHFPRSTVASHSGNLILGYLGDKKVAVLQGRFHFYEGYSTKEVAFPIRVLSLLGAKTLIVTNAAGGLNPLFQAGSIMVFRDHLNFLGENPLRGPNIDNWGPRFPDFSTPYHPGLIKTALDSASFCKIANVISGVYVCIPGPSLETPAETRWLRESGADAVGMSSVPEIIVAKHGGMDVLGLSVVSNVNDPDNFEPIILEDIIATAEAMEPKLEQLIVEIAARIPS
ncbi:inosine guanosine and xanthosine phosphorylase family protein [Desulfocapsa sulfexigens DSM 10523]|uniref:Purine nucleoside phosphorylase n=1 Tax=Desulfocapsa sulfexigens (strain DSM 10523 / SB164P1) TaxID=1167006 RepID=M1P4I9_DESSD|nr:purine-nucleoside phosphorylase [Desulfocapsa sulfexigens]AGF76612.1 inosine guanosine and xanthosine phosphorylase family protein [Desulfocapsa sulfexigens DSM 10523]